MRFAKRCTVFRMLQASVLGALTLLGSHRAADAQSPDLRLEARAGLAIPSGDLADVTTIGGTVGGGVAWYFLPHIGIRADIQYDLLDDAQDAFGSVFPPLRLLHATGGLEVDFPRPAFQHYPLSLRANAGIGVTRFDADESFLGFSEDLAAVDETYLTFTGGVRVGYRVHPSVDLFLSGQTYVMLTEEEDMAVLVAGSQVEPFDSAWVFPVTVGAAIGLP